jgi:hypothetical protein
MLLIQRSTSASRPSTLSLTSRSICARSSSTVRSMAMLASPTKGSTVTMIRVTSRAWMPSVRCRGKSGFMEVNDTMVSAPADRWEHGLGGNIGPISGPSNAGPEDLARHRGIGRGVCQISRFYTRPISGDAEGTFDDDPCKSRKTG